MAKKRTNVVPIIEDARHPHKYRMLVPMVDTIFADVAQPDQVKDKNYHNCKKTMLNNMLVCPPFLFPYKVCNL